MPSVVLLFVLCAAAPPADTLVVCPAEFERALAPWLEHRRGQGHRIATISNEHTSDQLRREIGRVAKQGALRTIVLVGDADPRMAHQPSLRRRSVPTRHVPAVVNLKFGGTELEIASDNWYADLDGDRVPELAVGRLTADTPEELSLIVQKILAYEQSVDYGHWRRRVHFVAGLGGFGLMTDLIVETAAKSLISDGVPAAYSTTMTYGSWQSPYCPDPRRFRDVTLDRLNEGSLFWVYIGHGMPRSVDYVHVPGGAFPILNSLDTPRLACRHGAPIACFFACYAGAFDMPSDCLAEDMLRSPGGPVAILCGTRVTMPYGLAVLGSELLESAFVEQWPTVGEAVLAAKRRSASASDTRGRGALDALGKAISPSGSDLAAERAEHLDLFTLLGDPLLRLPYPRALEVQVTPAAAAGESLEISGNSPLAGACTVELVVRRDRLTFAPPRRPQFDPAQIGDYSQVYQRANEPRLAARHMTIADGRFAARLEVPREAKGACHVRVFVEGADGCAAGAANIQIDAAVVPAIGR